jgi:hypothetical protein
MLLYNYGNTLIYLYLDLQSEYYQLSLHFIDPCLTTDIVARLSEPMISLNFSVPVRSLEMYALKSD